MVKPPADDDAGPASSLVRAIIARLHAASNLYVDPHVSAGALSAATAEFDVADAAYRQAIETNLPPHEARETLAALTAFRSRVSALRKAVRSPEYIDLDPLDTYGPPATGSHAQAVRNNAATDAARAEVAALRAELNAKITGLLERIQIERLVEAKRVRNAAFDRSLRAALPPGTSDKLATQILLLVDGWY
jgi:hypothetical protein